MIALLFLLGSFVTFITFILVSALLPERQAMETITVLEGDDLRLFCEVLGIPQTESRSIYRIRIAQSKAGAIKVKVNEGMWTPSFGAVQKP